MIHKVTRFATAAIIIHVLISAPHALAHQILGIYLPLLPTLFVLVVILTLPIVAGLLLWKRFYRTAGVILFGSMVGSLIFGLYYHFIVINPDHISHAPAGFWGAIFQLTAVLLFFSEAWGSLAGAWVLKPNLLPVWTNWSSQNSINQ